MDINMKQLKLDIRLIYLLLIVFIAYTYMNRSSIKVYPMIYNTYNDTIIVTKTNL